jgi:hypothetical protein
MGRIGIRLGGSQSKAAAEVLARHQPADIAAVIAIVEKYLADDTRRGT